jgi:hypothetical protein
MTQTMYAHVNNLIIIIINVSPSIAHIDENAHNKQISFFRAMPKSKRSHKYL